MGVAVGVLSVVVGVGEEVQQRRRGTERDVRLPTVAATRGPKHVAREGTQGGTQQAASVHPPPPRRLGRRHAGLVHRRKGYREESQGRHKAVRRSRKVAHPQLPGHPATHL
jgi:hypothetical protein